MLIYDGVKLIQPRYNVVTDDATYFVEANRCEVAQDDGIIIFSNKDSVQAMFRLDDVKALWRIL
jgi:hypothetical protein